MRLSRLVSSLVQRVIRSAPTEGAHRSSQRSVRRSFAEHLRGSGIELGALNAPLDVDGVLSIDRLSYVDRYRKAELLELFPELLEVRDEIVETDITCDIIEGLAPFADSSLDFVVACHLIEHVPDPIFFLKEVWRVLAVGGRC